MCFSKRIPVVKRCIIVNVAFCWRYYSCMCLCLYTCLCRSLCHHFLNMTLFVCFFIYSQFVLLGQWCFLSLWNLHCFWGPESNFVGGWGTSVTAKSRCLELHLNFLICYLCAESDTSWKFSFPLLSVLCTVDTARLSSPSLWQHVSVKQTCLFAVNIKVVRSLKLSSSFPIKKLSDLCYFSHESTLTSWHGA